MTLLDGLNDLIEKYLVLIVVLLFAVGFIFWLITRSNASRQNKETKRTFWDYYFLWPLLLSRKEGDKYVQRGFTSREWIWILILVLTCISAVLFFPDVKK